MIAPYIDPRVLALDLGVNVGWAIMGRGHPTPHCRTHKLPKVAEDDYGIRGHDLRVFLVRTIKAYKPTVVGFESPFVPFVRDDDKPVRFGKKKFVATQHGIRLGIGLAMIVEEVAVDHGLQVYELQPRSVKASFAGSANADKEDMQLEATRRGWLVADGHQADACGVGDAIIINLRERYDESRIVRQSPPINF